KLAAFQSVPWNRAFFRDPGVFIEELLGDVQDRSRFCRLLRGYVLVCFLQEALERIRDTRRRLSSQVDCLTDLSLKREFFGRCDLQHRRLVIAPLLSRSLSPEEPGGQE